MSTPILVWTTWPDAEKARAAARILVEEQLIACANLVPGVESIYRWEGKVETASEVLMVLKTTMDCYQMVEAKVKALHPYEVPEIISQKITDGLPAYLVWLDQNSNPSWK